MTKKRSSPSAPSAIELLDVDVADIEAGAEDAVVGDDEVVAELGADDADGVEAVAAVDADRALTTYRMVSAPPSPFMSVRARSLSVEPAQREGADGEDVVAVAAVEVQRPRCCGRR